MKYTAATLALAAGATAHTLMSEIYVDGEGQGSGTCIRSPNNADGAVDPIIDLGSSDMACGQDGTMGVARTCGMNAGQELTFEYRQWPDDPSRQSLAKGHMGPCSVYLKKVEDATQDSATGDGWFKLWDEGYVESSGQWCTWNMIDNNGRITVKIPESLQGGDYLVRPELLALHNIPEKHQPEFYIGCAQVFLQSSGSEGPAETVSIPGHVTGEDPGTTYNPFEKPLKPYTVPGPDVYKSVNKGSAMNDLKQTTGLPKEGTIVSNRNWCGVEVPSWNDEDSCWDADKDCWAQLDECYDTAGATGLEGCKIFQDYCKGNQATCKSGGSGPQNAGKHLSQQFDHIQTPAAVNGMTSYGSTGGSSDSGSDSQSNDQASSSSAPAPSPDSYKKKEMAAPAPSSEEAAPAPQYTSAPPAYSAPAPQAQATTLVTKAAADQGNPNVVYETVYETVNAYATVTDMAYATETVQAYRRHAHPRHARHV